MCFSLTNFRLQKSNFRLVIIRGNLILCLRRMKEYVQEFIKKICLPYITTFITANAIMAGVGITIHIQHELWTKLDEKKSKIL